MHQKGHVIHTEFASFPSNEFFELFEKYVAKNSHSLGLNEQELGILLKFWSGKEYDVTKAEDSTPSVEESLRELNYFYKVAKEREYKVTRVHMHPHGSFLMCYDRTKWEDARESIIKSSLTVPEYCIQ